MSVTAAWFAESVSSGGGAEDGAEGGTEGDAEGGTEGGTEAEGGTGDGANDGSEDGVNGEPEGGTEGGLEGGTEGGSEDGWNPAGFDTTGPPLNSPHSSEDRRRTAGAAELGGSGSGEQSRPETAAGRWF